MRYLPIPNDLAYGTEWSNGGFGLARGDSGRTPPLYYFPNPIVS
jgi:hypothetical protein